MSNFEQPDYKQIKSKESSAEAEDTLSFSLQEKVSMPKSVEEQTKHGELASIILFERLHNLNIRKQIIDILMEEEQMKAGNIVTTVRVGPDGNLVRNKNGRFVYDETRYVPQTREKVEERNMINE